MKNKLKLFVVAVILATSTAMYQSCKKESTSEIKPETVVNSSSSLIGDLLPRLNDIELIRAVKGLNLQYREPSELIELLLDNRALSANVLAQVASETRLSNDFVEVVFIVSAPVSAQSIDQLRLKRPSLSLTNILKAQAQVTHNMKFAIANYPARGILFGENLIRTSMAGEACTDCSSLFSNGTKGVILIQFGNPGGDPGFLFGFGCNKKKWICGIPRVIINAHLAGIGTEQQFLVTCEPGNVKCVRRPDN